MGRRRPSAARTAQEAAGSPRSRTLRPDGGTGYCTTGSCPGYQESSFKPVFTATTPPTGPPPGFDANGKPIPIEQLGKNQRGVEGVDKDGNKILKVKPEGGDVQTCTVGKDCQGPNKDSLSTPVAKPSTGATASSPATCR